MAVWYQLGMRLTEACMLNPPQGLGIGLGLYGTYELTNMSIIATWSWSMVAADVAWGSFACALAAVIMHSLQSWLTRQGR